MKITNYYFYIGVMSGVGLGILVTQAWQLGFWKEMGIVLGLLGSILKSKADRKVEVASPRS